MMNRILFAVLLLLLPLDVFAQAPLLWELQEDIDGGTDLARAITLSGKSVVVVGNGGEPLEGTDESDLVIQALVGRTELSHGAIRRSCRMVRLSLSMSRAARVERMRSAL